MAAPAVALSTVLAQTTSVVGGLRLCLQARRPHESDALRQSSIESPSKRLQLGSGVQQLRPIVPRKLEIELAIVMELHAWHMSSCVYLLFQE